MMGQEPSQFNGSNESTGGFPKTSSNVLVPPTPSPEPERAMPTPGKTPRQNSAQKRIPFPSVNDDTWSNTIGPSETTALPQSPPSSSPTSIRSTPPVPESPISGPTVVFSSPPSVSTAPKLFEPAPRNSIVPRSILTGSSLHAQQSRASAPSPAKRCKRQRAKNVIRITIPTSRMAAAKPPMPVPQKPNPEKPTPKIKRQWGFLVTRKVTHPSAESENLIFCSKVRDANRAIRGLLAPLEDGGDFRDNWTEEFGGYGELTLTNKMAENTTTYEVQRMFIRPEGYGKPLQPQSKKRNRRSFEEEKDEMANWEGWTFNQDFHISESELSYWEGWQFDVSQDTLDVKAKKLRRGERGDKGGGEMACWDGWTQERNEAGGFTPVDTGAVGKALEWLDYYDEVSRERGI
ncbi:hypothetical protein EG328_009575 [Venturia inaequalis]|uniref:Uncharacterized protein n=1 Tax=Venturia inaequalis TaxID=5025 RepID=A0A8H3UEF0_VENIN|nr:hypothetical protein EG328_009575 [Venturia inaequalis]KAE9968098.1 hypothetical protein EG327_011184 [Venturia inaequalis]